MTMRGRTVPGEIVIDHEVRPLHVDTLASSVGRHQDTHVWVVEEEFLRLPPLLASHAAMNDHHCVRSSKETPDLMV
jgi:hypothetical protein